MRTLIGMLGLAAIGLAGGAHAADAPADIDWAQVPTLSIKLTSFDFDPNVLRLPQGKPVRLLLENDSTGGHDFSAPEFFAAARYKAGTSAPPKGDVELDGGTKAEIDLVPDAPGTYQLECTHFMHSTFGMTGRIEVMPAS